MRSSKLSIALMYWRSTASLLMTTSLHSHRPDQQSSIDGRLQIRPTQVHLRKRQRTLSQGLWRYGGDHWHIDAERPEPERRFHQLYSIHKCLGEAAGALEVSRRATDRYSTAAIPIKREQAEGYIS